MNTCKTMVLMVTLSLMLVGIGAILGGKSGMTIALVIAFGMNFISYWFSDKIVLKMYGAREVSEAQAPELYSMTRELSYAAGLPMPKVYLMEQDAAECLCHRQKPGTWRDSRNHRHYANAVEGRAERSACP